MKKPLMIVMMALWTLVASGQVADKFRPVEVYYVDTAAERAGLIGKLMPGDLVFQRTPPELRTLKGGSGEAAGDWEVFGLQEALDAYGDVPGLSAAINAAKDRGNHTGTQALSTISDAGTMAAEDAEEYAEFDLEAQKISQAVATFDMASTPWCIKKVGDYLTGGGGSQPPITVVVMGDSLSSGISFAGPKMAVTGAWGTGAWGVFTGGAAMAGDNDYWYTGYVNIPVGGTATFYWQSATFNQLFGDTTKVAYIKEPGAGSFDWEHSTDGGNTWTKAATINASHTSIAGEVNSYYHSDGKFRRVVRATNVTGGPVKIVAWFVGNYDSGGAHVVGSMFNGGGYDMVNFTPVPDAITTPIWSAISPDLVLSCWADGASNYEDGGAWRTLYSRFKAIKNETDFVLIAPNPGEDETGREATRIAQWEWAKETREGYIDGWSIYGDGYAEANARGFMGDAVHLALGGTTLRNQYIWDTLAIGRVEMGQSMWQGVNNSILNRVNDGAVPSIRMLQGLYGIANDMWFSHGIRVPGIRLMDKTDWYSGQFGRIYIDSANGQMTFGNVNGAQFRTNGPVSQGLMPGADGKNLGVDNLRWLIYPTSIVFEGATVDNNETTVGVIDPTADRTISFPDATGTVSVGISATAALDFDLSSSASQDLTITVTGAEVGDVVDMGVPHGSVTADTVFGAWVSATNTVTVRAIRVSGTPNPSSGTFRATVRKQ